jgi:hypothetical protein
MRDGRGSDKPTRSGYQRDAHLPLKIIATPSNAIPIPPNK